METMAANHEGATGGRGTRNSAVAAARDCAFIALLAGVDESVAAERRQRRYPRSGETPVQDAARAGRALRIGCAGGAAPVPAEAAVALIMRVAGYAVGEQAYAVDALPSPALDIADALRATSVKTQIRTTLERIGAGSAFCELGDTI